MPLINLDQVDAVAHILSTVRQRIYQYADSFSDPKFYPPPGSDRYTIVKYFVVMVAMDHRLYRPGRSYEAVIDGMKLFGADLLYYLGARKLEEDPDFFEAKNLAKVSVDDVIKWLSVGDARPPDPDIRAFLLRDLGVKLLVLYRGDYLEMIDRCEGYIRRMQGYGYTDTLRIFRAFEDPVEKKIMLLLKFLERRGVIEIKDSPNKRVPVDNHLTRIALRLGIVELEPYLLRKVTSFDSIEYHEDIVIRTCVKEAWDLVAKRAGIDPFILDDALWTFGRCICLDPYPRCENCKDHPLCHNGKCVFIDVCREKALRRGIRDLNYFDTWYY